MSLGGMAGVALAGWLLDPKGSIQLPWEWLFVGFSLPGILWAMGYYFWFRDDPADHSGVSEQELRLIQDEPPSEVSPPSVVAASATSSTNTEAAAKPVHLKTPWLAILSSPAMFWICGQQFFRASAYMFFASWFPQYLQATRGVSLANSGYLTALPLMAVVVGGLIGGVVSDVAMRRTGSRRWGRQFVATVALLICAAMIFGAYFIDDAVLAVCVISVGTLAYAIGGPTSYAITIDMGDKHVATVFSTMNMAGNVGAAIFPILVPIFKDATSWESVLLLFGGMYLAAAFCWIMLNPEGSVFDQSLLRGELEAETRPTP
jgi:ACS family glucarate transporter-like MFS transporter/ACS family D-galactonate transporter-like MFS transporter